MGLSIATRIEGGIYMQSSLKLFTAVLSMFAISAQAADCGDKELDRVLTSSTLQLASAKRLAKEEELFLKNLKSQHDLTNNVVTKGRVGVLVVSGTVVAFLAPGAALEAAGAFQGSGALAGAGLFAVSAPVTTLLGLGGTGMTAHHTAKNSGKLEQLSVQEALWPLEVSKNRSPSSIVEKYDSFNKRSRELASQIDQAFRQNEVTREKDGVVTKFLYGDARAVETQVLASKARLELHQSMATRLAPWVSYMNGLCAQGSDSESGEERSH